MNKVDISAEAVDLPVWDKAAKKFILKTLAKIHRVNWDISILFCNNAFIQELNERYRQKKESTDILSFPISETIHENGKERYIAGDIVISLESLPENAERFGISQDEELRRLLVHGILHLDGLEHTIHDISADALAAEPMLFLQEHIISELSEERILSV